MRLLVKHATGPVSGDLLIPNSKYHAHRALILASLAPGVSRIDGLSDAGHVRYTISSLRSLGTEITTEDDTFVVRGGPYRPAQTEVSVGSSGTTYYFLTGLASLATAPVTIIGQRYFQRRPITPLLAALEQMGVSLESAAGCPPIAVQNKRPAGGHVRIAGTLSQWISGLLLLAPFATGPSVIEVEGELNERTYIDLTIRMMKDFGLHVAASPDGKRYEIEGGQQIRPADVTLPPDIGSAAFGLASVALHPADVLFRGLRTTSGAETDHPEADLLDIVTEMGLPMTTDPATGFVRVRHDGGLKLRPVRVDCRLVPDMLPVLSTLATAADGTTVLDNIAHVRLKESDRVSAMLQLNQMGGNLEVRGDSLHITGVPALSGADLSSFNDHRVLMALAIAGTRAEGETRLTFPNAYRISYPRFLEEMNGIGMSMSVAPSTAREKARPRVPASGTGTPARVAKTRIGDWVRRWARERPDDPAVIGLDAANSVSATGEPGERQWTWRELDTEADKVASLLLELGVQPGEAVSCQLPNVLEFTALVLACTRVGAVITPLMPIFRQREMSFMLGRAKARVVVVPAEFRGRDYPAEIASVAGGGGADGGELPLEHVVVLDGDVPASRGPGAGTREGGQEARGVRGNLVWHSYSEAVGRQRPDRGALDARAPEPDDFAQLLFTSGTSGEPKGVLQRMDSLTRAAAMEIRHLGLNADDRIYIPSPLAHQTGFLYGMWLAFLLGVPQLLQQHWDAPAALSLLRRHHGTFTQAATPFLSDLLDLVEKTGEAPEDLRIFVATGAAVPRAMAERATRTLDAAVCGAWGTTETCLGALAAPSDEPAKVWGTDGRALNGVRLRITDDDGNVLAAGAEGNFEVKSDCLFDSYLDRPDLTAEVLTADGWYKSGDLAVIDEAGFVRISGRVKDVINRGGEKVPVAEIEQLLHTHPKVKDVAIVAMPDPRLGERACAFVQSAGPAGGGDGTGDDLGFEEMRRFLDDARVAKQYWPERLEIIGELPRTQTGKVQKFMLRERIRAMIEDEAR
jgi:3-phosphoshikimate 1-carboxyvinyltransferase